jgi:hypothetical protein
MVAAENRQTIYVPDEDLKLIERIKRDAEREDRSVSYIILRILRKHYGLDKGKRR